MVVCLERDADLHMVQLMPLPLTVSCFSKIQIGFTFLVPAHPGSPGKKSVKRVCVLVGTIKRSVGRVRPSFVSTLNQLTSDFDAFLMYHSCMGIGNESVPIQLAQCWFPGLATSNAKI